VKLPHLDSWSEARRNHAAAYTQIFEGSSVVTPWIHPETVSIYNQYVVRVPRRDEVVDHLKSLQIGNEVYYPLPLHLQECFHDLGYKNGDLPESERAAKEVLALPVYPELTQAQLEHVGNTILDWLSR
jgi:dTDP-4-amino-4,6-dideoxygalactose transaminase